MVGTMERVLRTPEDIDAWAEYLKVRQLPLRVSAFAAGRVRTDDQNRCLHAWCGEVAEYYGDQTLMEVKAFVKLAFGVPVLCHANPAFAAKWESLASVMTYEQKLEVMAPPVELPVTSIMNTKQLSQVLDATRLFYLRQGIALTPEDKYYETQTR